LEDVAYATTDVVTLGGRRGTPQAEAEVKAGGRWRRLQHVGASWAARGHVSVCGGVRCEVGLELIRSSGRGVGFDLEIESEEEKLSLKVVGYYRVYSTMIW